MSIYTLMSPGDSPGVTTTGLAVTHAWGGRALLAECDPKGGDVLAGFLSARMPAAGRGLLSLALAIAHNPDSALLWDHLISLDQDVRDWLLLPGLRDPREVAQLEGAWEAIAAVLRATTTADVLDVVIDVGRIGGGDTPMPLIAASDLVVMLLRPTLRQVAAAKPRLDALGRRVGTSVPVSLCLIGHGDYTAREVGQALFGLPVLADIPYDPKSAAVLSDGKPAKRSMRTSGLLRGAAALAIAMRCKAEAAHFADESNEVAYAAWGTR